MCTTRKGSFLAVQALFGLVVFGHGVTAALGFPPEERQSGLVKAKSSEEQGLFEEAVRQYQVVLRKSPSSTQARLGLGRSLANLGRCEEAAQGFGAVAGTGPIRAQAEAVVGTCHFRVRDYGPAVTHLENAVRLNPRAKDAWIFLGRSYAGSGQYGKAIEILRSWLTQNGDDVDVLYWIGKFYEELAATTFQKMADSYPDSYLVYLAQGEQYLEKKDYKKAEEALDRALALAPAAPGVHYTRGNLYWRQRKLDEAREELEQELRSNPFHAQANYLLGDIYVTFRQPDMAIPFLERAIASNPTIWDAHRALGRAYVMKDRLEEAIREFQIVAEANPTDHSIHGLLSNAYRRLGDMQKARKEAEIFQKLSAERLERVPKPRLDDDAALSDTPE